MDRRTFLGAVGSVGAVALAGCLADGGSDETPADTERQTDTPTPRPTPMPTMLDSEFTVRDSRSGTQQDSATVAVDGAAVAVQGTIWGRNGCRTAELASATYSGAADELTVDVATTEREDAGDMCTQAIVELDYRATVAFEGGTPGTVVVTHSRGDETALVATRSP